MNDRQLLRIASLVVGVLLTLSACGGTSSSSSSPSGHTSSKAAVATQPAKPAAQLVHLTFGYNLNGGQTPSYVARTMGFFEKNGLDAKAVQFSTLSNGVAALSNGSIQVLSQIPGGLWAAREAGYDFVSVMQNETSHLTRPDMGVIMVRASGNIKTLKDLAGKRAACVALNSQDCLDFRYLLQQAGVNNVHFVSAPFPTQFDLLRSKQVDAVSTIDPFKTQMLSTGVGRILVHTYLATIPGQPIGAWWTTRKFATAHAATVERFDAAIKGAIDWLHAHPSNVRQVEASFTGLPANILKKMPLENWNYEVDPATWQKEAALLVKEGGLKRLPDPKAYFAPEIKTYFVSKNVQFFANENAALRSAS